MSVWFKWAGIDELVAQFRTLAPDLTDAATPDVETAAKSAKATIAAGYPVRTGNLKNSLAVLVAHGPASVKATVVNTSPHAAMFERGTQARHIAIGANRGSMPANPIFSATMVRTRRNLYPGPITRVLERFGLKVTGSA